MLSWLRDGGRVLDTLGDTEQNDQALKTVKDAAAFADRLEEMAPGDTAAALSDICERIDVAQNNIAITLARQRLLTAIGAEPTATAEPKIPLAVPARPVRVGGETRMLTPEDETNSAGEPDPAIIRVLAKAHDWAGRLTSGEAASVTEIAKLDGVAPGYVKRLLPLAFHSPAVVEDLLNGRHPKSMTAERLTRSLALEASWARQAKYINDRVA